ncbi:MAG: GNAT family N-acetyltransferase [Bacteroidales bacterium]|nr:GNAT family N-acetyltransferase [Bacteroidales bacterium]MBR4116298.1 GNAT family N-acetyltransferase [Bacteroidales bacterium]
MDFDIFTRLTENHIFRQFDCGDDDLNSFLLIDSFDYQKQLLSVTYFIEKQDKTILFFSLSNDKITAIETTNGFWRKIKSIFPHSKHRKDYPAVKIGRFAVHKDFQNTSNHWGSLVIDYIKHWMLENNKTGCRFITVDAYLSAVPFYQKNGFEFMGNEERIRYEKSKGDTVAMYYDLMNIAKLS